MSTIFTKLRDFVGLNDPADYEYEYDEMDGEEYQNLYEQENQAPQPQPQPQPVTGVSTAATETRAPRRRVRDRVMSTDSGMVSMNMNNSMSSVSNVIGMPGAINGVSEVIVMEPRSFEEMPQAIQALRERKSVVLNLTIMDPDQAQRAVDFVAGGTYAMDGHQERIGESIFLFTPNCVQVSMPVDADDTLPMQEEPSVASTAAPTPAWATEQVARMA
ncbi:cell division protein [Leptolyngbya sp. Heron Island J]|uniref:cell division protein SepF n=1 Tax=Leptolyngbya sp. Heron Island J TaxID=1385935 RepID=UPI0003B990C1|nr:cell division protein SepF [Leptolyngbya sp. Heron Island J]ESA33754.1 cell division protein [Leptolyngbya sp. Heron Island J]